MDTNLGKFKMLALRTMAGDELKEEFDDVLKAHDRNQHCIEY